MAEPFNLVGPSYSSQSLNAAAQQTMNFYPEVMEIGDENQKVVLYPTPGIKTFGTAGSKTRGIGEINGFCFFVSSDALYQLNAVTGAATFINNVADDSKPVSMAFYGNQMLLASAGTAYVLDIPSVTLTPIADLVGVSVIKVDFCDGFFIALIGNSNTFRISAPLDATSWDPLDFAQVTVFPGTLRSMIVDHREIWVFGTGYTTVYVNTGNVNFPFEVNSSASVIETGCEALNSLVKLDNTIFWVGRDVRGRGVVWKASGYTPQRVSNHALEYTISQYGDISDVVGYAYQDQGHSFYVLFFPTAEVLAHETKTHTWVYDAATGQWHERGFWDTRLAEFEAHHSWNHVFLGTRHLVGDWNSGNIYEMSIDLLDDDGTLIRRVRRAPHISQNQMWSFHSQLQVFVQPGVGPTPPLLDGVGNPRDPIMNLRWSNDGAQTWSSEVPMGVGQVGQYAKRVVWRRLGRSRDRVYEINMSDPVVWRIISGFLDVEPGIS